MRGLLPPRSTRLAELMHDVSYAFSSGPGVLLMLGMRQKQVLYVGFAYTDFLHRAPSLYGLRVRANFQIRGRSGATAET